MAEEEKKPRKPRNNGIFFVDLKPHQCKWPVSLTRFCGAPTTTFMASYCTKHAAVAKPAKTERRGPRTNFRLDKEQLPQVKRKRKREEKDRQLLAAVFAKVAD